MQEDLIHVALALHDNTGDYAKNLGVVMQSMFENTNEKICVHLLHDKTLTPDNAAKLKLIAENFNQELALIDVSKKINQLGQDALKLSGVYSAAMFFRLLLPEALQDLTRVIYLDGDIVVNMNIKALWDVELGDKLLGGVRDAGRRCVSWLCDAQDMLRARWLGCGGPDYINSGVLLINLAGIRESCDLISEACSWFKIHWRHALSPDQDFINSFFKGRIKFIDERFNYHASHRDLSNAIIHFILSRKPWRKLHGTPAEELYWQEFIKTPFYDGDTSALIGRIIDLDYATHKTLRDKLADRGSRWADFHLHIRPDKYLGLLFREAWHRLIYHE